jgi:hypothetical protein
LAKKQPVTLQEMRDAMRQRAARRYGRTNKS